MCISLPLLQRRPVSLRSENFISTGVEVHCLFQKIVYWRVALQTWTPPLSAKDILQDWKWNCSGTCKIALCVCVGNLLISNWYIPWNVKILIRHTSENILHWAFHLWKEHSFANLRSSKHLWNAWKRKLALVPTKTVDMACKCYVETVHYAIYKCQSHGFGLWQSAFWAVVTCSKMGSAETRAPTCSLGDVSTLLSYQTCSALSALLLLSLLTLPHCRSPSEGLARIKNLFLLLIQVKIGFVVIVSWRVVVR